MTRCVFGETSKTSSAQVMALLEATGRPVPSCKLRSNKWVHMCTCIHACSKVFVIKCIKSLLKNKMFGAPIISTLGRLRQEECEFETSLSYIYINI
jgi:hypothetical protein